MTYFIAYKDVNGNDFGGLPWVIPEGGFDDIKMAKNVKNDFIRRGFKDVKLFLTKTTDIFERFDWNFINDNLVIE